MLSSKSKTFIASLAALFALSACGPGFKTEEEKKQKTLTPVKVTSVDTNSLLSLAASQSAEIKAMVDDPAIRNSLTVETTFGLNLVALKTSGELSGQQSVVHITIKVRAPGKEATTLVVSQENTAALSYSPTPSPNVSGYFTIERPAGAYPIYVGINMNIVGNPGLYRVEGSFVGNFLDNANEGKEVARFDSPLCEVMVEPSYLNGTGNLSGIDCGNF